MQGCDCHCALLLLFRRCLPLLQRLLLLLALLMFALRVCALAHSRAPVRATQ
jgi:hypothetical protein